MFWPWLSSSPSRFLGSWQIGRGELLQQIRPFPCLSGSSAPGHEDAWPVFAVLQFCQDLWVSRCCAWFGLWFLLVLAGFCLFFSAVAPCFPCSGFGSFGFIWIIQSEYIYISIHTRIYIYISYYVWSIRIHMLDSDGFSLCVAKVEAGFIAARWARLHPLLICDLWLLLRATLEISNSNFMQRPLCKCASCPCPTWTSPCCARLWGDRAATGCKIPASSSASGGYHSVAWYVTRCGTSHWHRL